MKASPAVRGGATARLPAGVAAVALLVVTGWAAGLAHLWRASQVSADVVDTLGPHCSFDRRADAGADHVTDPTYTVEPPSGGPHLAVAAGPGVYGGPEVPPDGALVHSLEHGYVVVWHRADLSADQRAALHGLVQRYPRDVIVVPRPASPHAVVATAWTARMPCDDTSAAELDTFVQQFRRRGPERIPH